MTARTSVVAAFDGNGHVKPVAFRYGGLRLTVNHIYWKIIDPKDKKITFCCATELDGHMREVQLFYMQKSSHWYINLKN